MTATAHHGRCLCGDVTYSITGPLVAATLCHCTDCRRATGGTNVAWAVFDKGDVAVTGAVADYESSPGIHWGHCPRCHALVTYRRAGRPDHLDIATGTLDDPDAFPPAVEIWVTEKIGWEPLHPDLPKRARSSLNEPDGGKDD